MKTINLYLTALIFLICVKINAQVIYPIPSYNIPVTKFAIFQESGITSSSDNSDGKKHIIIQPHMCTQDSVSCSCTAYIYSLDGQTKLGPYTVNCGETLSVDIDDRLWGVTIITTCPICVDVYISESGNTPVDGTGPNKPCED